MCHHFTNNIQSFFYFILENKRRIFKMIDMTGWKMSEHGVPDSKWTVIKYAGKSKWQC